MVRLERRREGQSPRWALIQRAGVSRVALERVAEDTEGQPVRQYPRNRSERSLSPGSPQRGMDARALDVGEHRDDGVRLRRRGLVRRTGKQWTERRLQLQPALALGRHHQRARLAGRVIVRIGWP